MRSCPACENRSDRLAALWPAPGVATVEVRGGAGLLLVVAKLMQGHLEDTLACLAAQPSPCGDAPPPCCWLPRASVGELPRPCPRGGAGGIVPAGHRTRLRSDGCQTVSVFGLILGQPDKAKTLCHIVKRSLDSQPAQVTLPAGEEATFMALPAGGQGSALEAVMGVWVERQVEIHGRYQINLSTTALAAVLCADCPALDQILVSCIPAPTHCNAGRTLASATRGLSTRATDIICSALPQAQLHYCCGHNCVKSHLILDRLQIVSVSRDLVRAL